VDAAVHGAIARRVPFGADRIALAGSASVRSCVKKGTKFMVGLEFSGGMTWKHPAAKKQDAALEAPQTEPVAAR